MLERIADGRTDLVFDCLLQGMSPSAEVNGVSLIRWCSYYGDVSAIKYLLAHGESLDSLGENFDLNAACFHGHWRLVQSLLEHGADANYPLPDTGETPLHSATAKANDPRYDHVVKVLLAHSADPNCATTAGVATDAFMRDVRTKGETPLHRAAAFGTIESVRMLIDAGANVEATDINGDTPLSWASWHLRPASILQLLCYGEHRIGEGHVAHYTGDHGSGFDGMERSLLGEPDC
jgi:ankyrin repeat protein